MIEALLGLSLVSVLVGALAAYSVPTLAREKMRSSVYDIHVLLQLARTEAISHNRDCRFVLDTGAGTLEVWDGLGTTSSSDDIVLYSRRLPESVGLARPDTGPTVTLDQIGATTGYQTVFASDGIVAAGTGSVFLHGGFRYVRVSVHGAGGVELAQWNGSEWERI